MPLPTTMKDKVKLLKSRFPWLSYKKNEVRTNYAWCNLCDMAVFLPNTKECVKHQRTTQHISLRNGGQPPEPTEGVVAAKTATVSASGKARPKAPMAELQSKYNWLEADPSDENRGHCAVCNTRLPINVFYLRQHDASRKHVDGMERHRNNNAKEAAPPVSMNPEATSDVEVQESGLDKGSDTDISVRSDGGTAEPPAKRSCHSMVVRPISEEHSQLNMAKDMINSSFDIVTRLRTIEREGAKGYVKAPEPVKEAPTSAQPSEPRHVMDLFFESVASTMKSLPAVLAAEGKAKIMQLVCGLEVRAIHRKTPAASKPSNAAAEPLSASVQAAAAANDIMQTNNNNDMESTPNNSASGAHAPSLTINGNPEDLPGNTRGIPSQLLVTSRNVSNPVRCVPMYKLTTQSVNGNGRHSHGGSFEEPSMPVTEINNVNTMAD